MFDEDRTIHTHNRSSRALAYWVLIPTALLLGVLVEYFIFMPMVESAAEFIHTYYH